MIVELPTEITPMTIPLVVVFLVQLLKMVLPKVEGQVWFMVALSLGVIAYVGFVTTQSPPLDGAAWVRIVYDGILNGAGATILYDRAAPFFKKRPTIEDN